MKEQRSGAQRPTKVEYISVDINAEALPDPGPCRLCGSDMDKVPLGYKIKDNPVTVESRESIPGYRCRSCNAEYYDGSVTLELYKETLPTLSSTSNLRGPIEQRINSLTKALT